MHVVMVAHSFPRHPGDPAGHFLWQLAEAMAVRGHTVTAIAPADRGESGEPSLGRVAVRRVRYAAPARETLAYRGTMHRLAGGGPLAAVTFASLVRALARAVTAECRAAPAPADLIHAHWWVPGGLATRLADRSGRPYLVTLHGTDVALARRVPGGNLLMRWALGRAAAVTAVSSSLAAAAAELTGRSAADIAVEPMPLAPAVAGSGQGPRREGAVFVGRLTAQKHVADLLEAIALLGRRGTAPHLTVVGDGPERAALERRAASADLAGRISFTGMVPPGAVPEHLADKRVCVLPSVDEGLGLVVAEALAAGVPVVAARSGGIPELLTDPAAGVLVPAADPAALADAIQTVGGDDRYLAGAARAGRALQRRLSPDAVAQRFERIYDRALARRGRS